MSEIWKEIPGFPTYYVSDAGRVQRIVTLKPNKGHNGYLSVVLYRQGCVKRLRIHRLVLAAFVGPSPEGREVSHLDGKRTHNALANLAYATKRENVALKRTHGTHQFGSAIHKAKLNDAAVREIRAAAARGGKWGVKHLMSKFGVSRSAIQSVAYGETWRHVT